MPIYEYTCSACGKPSEVMHKVSEQPGDCPHCGVPALVKQISAAGFRLAGSGWYETDFKTGNKHNLAEGSADSAPACAPEGCDSAGCAVNADG